VGSTCRGRGGQADTGGDASAAQEGATACLAYRCATTEQENSEICESKAGLDKIVSWAYKEVDWLFLAQLSVLALGKHNDNI
jgi:hypothetical protein